MKKMMVWVMSLLLVMSFSFASSAEDPPASTPVKKEVKNKKAKKKKKKSNKKNKKNKKGSQKTQKAPKKEAL
jgi:hypothetical protein